MRFTSAVNYENTIYIDPVDLICACRPQLRRVAVPHLILQNEKILPRPMLIRLYKVIDDYNRYRQREGQRPNWGLHMTEAHILAIADTLVPSDPIQQPHPDQPLTDPSNLPTPPPGRGGGKDYGGKGGGYFR